MPNRNLPSQTKRRCHPALAVPNCRRDFNPPPFGHKDPPVPAIAKSQDPQKVQDGALLFSSHCFLCHGKVPSRDRCPTYIIRAKRCSKRSSPSFSAGARLRTACRPSASSSRRSRWMRYGRTSLLAPRSRQGQLRLAERQPEAVDGPVNMSPVTAQPL